ncbi:hypothetical protein NDR87_01390 [Nocardia sp. CDC159]|uniref:Uncharacterized protein n=1 Tax=Nocardia pulmonis TaxID=2951408 RepID=A0A9X2E669_9NOCA|nr:MULTISPECIES: hypothetical protein [Nocardia]MCM6772336.1 hypothetical protein [Nocardia pulmonis]MCM6785006.1 hypothetical protein [Nocardia sp. CDC159]
MSAESLTRTLGSPLPEEFTRLSDARLGELDRLLREAQARRAKRLATAIDSSFDVIPRLMRPAVKKALGL